MCALVPKGQWEGVGSHTPSPAVRCRGCVPRSCRLHTFSVTLTSAVGQKGRAWVAPLEEQLPWAGRNTLCTAMPPFVWGRASPGCQQRAGGQGVAASHLPRKGCGYWWRTGATALALPPGGSRLHSRHSPAFWLHSTAPQHSRSPLTRWSRTRCVPHMLLIPGARDRRLSACRQLGPTLSNSPLLPPLLRLDHARTQEGPGAPLPAAPSCTFALYPQLPHGQSTAPPLPPLAHYSRSSPRCFGSAAQTRHTGHQGLEEGVPGAGGPT